MKNLYLKNEIDIAISNNQENIFKPSEETLDLITGRNHSSFMKLNFLNDMEPRPIIGGSIQYGPTIFI